MSETKQTESSTASQDQNEASASAPLQSQSNGGGAATTSNSKENVATEPSINGDAAVVANPAAVAAASKPLHNRWVMWYDNPKTSKDGQAWKDNLQHAGTIQSPADFWGIFNNLTPSSRLTVGSNYHLFREGVVPMWEDPANKDGGKWVLTIAKNNSVANRIDEWWMFTCLAIIGESMDQDADLVCGAVVSIRKSQDRLALWLKTNDGALASQVAARWKKAMQIPHRLKFQVHKDAASSGSSFRNEVIFEV